MKIKVEQRHIDMGIRGDCMGCPLFHAIKETTGHRYFIMASGCYDKDVANSPTLLLPWEAREAIRQFDSEQKMEPFEFELQLEG